MLEVRQAVAEENLDAELGSCCVCFWSGKIAMASWQGEARICVRSAIRGGLCSPGTGARSPLRSAAQLGLSDLYLGCPQAVAKIATLLFEATPSKFSKQC